jgi:hypothetical protein
LKTEMNGWKVSVSQLQGRRNRAYLIFELSAQNESRELPKCSEAR